MSTTDRPSSSSRVPGLACAVAAAVLTSETIASPAVAGTPYDAGKIRVTVALGSTRFSEVSYVIAGAGVGIFVVDGLELGTEGDYWIGDSPAIGELTPGARYVFFFVPEIQPYVGAFYRHRFISRSPDQDSIGAQAGLLYALGVGYIGGGAVYEHLVSHCTTSCSAVYPELVAALSF